MPELLSTSSNRRLARLLFYIFVSFVALGLTIGYVVGKIGERNAAQQTPPQEVVEEQISYEGTITYIEPFLHSEDKISYVLVDKSGKDVILLKATDQKLEIAEGHYATFYGKKKVTSKGEDYLLVDKIVIKNAAN